MAGIARRQPARIHLDRQGLQFLLPGPHDRAMVGAERLVLLGDLAQITLFFLTITHYYDNKEFEIIVLVKVAVGGLAVYDGQAGSRVSIARYASRALPTSLGAGRFAPKFLARPMARC